MVSAVGAMGPAPRMVRGQPEDHRQTGILRLPASVPGDELQLPGDELQLPGDELQLPGDELHVWRASLHAGARAVSMLASLLADDERERAGRFRFERDCSRYVVGRGLLRVLLGRYLATDPGEIRFAYGPYEKPQLAGAGPFFNLSHSGCVALFALRSGGELGIDVERDDADLAREQIPERFFSVAEVNALRALPKPLQSRAFLSCWTRKEAFLKARGDGLQLALDSFDVTLGPGKPAAITRTAWSDDEPTEWSLMDLSDPQQGYIAAVACRGRSWRAIRRGVAEIVDNEIVLDQEEA